MTTVRVFFFILYFQMIIFCDNRIDYRIFRGRCNFKAERYYERAILSLRNIPPFQLEFCNNDKMVDSII